MVGRGRGETSSGGMISTRKQSEDEEKEEEMFWKVPLPPECMHFVDSTDSDAFSRLLLAIEEASIIAMDAEWKPHTQGSGSPRVSILQIAFRLRHHNDAKETDCVQQGSEDGVQSTDVSAQDEQGEDRMRRGTEARLCYEMIFLIDLLALPASAFSTVLKNVFVDPAVLKLGFGFNQDLLHLRGTFPGPDAQGCFDKVEPYLDVGKLYRHLHANESTFMSRGRRITIGGEYSLAFISEKILGLPLSKEMQCSNWEVRPLTKRQFDYAVADAYSLLMIFDSLQVEFAESWFSPIVAGDDNEDVLWNRSKLGVAGLLAPEIGDVFGIVDKYTFNGVFQTKRGDATSMVKAALGQVGVSGPRRDTDLHRSRTSVTGGKTIGIDTLVHRFGEKLLVSGDQGVTNIRPRRKTRSRCAREAGKNRELQDEEDFQYVGPPPWDSAVGGDGIPKFLCDAMYVTSEENVKQVEGLARQLRCVGIDAASPNSKKCDPRELVDLAEKEGRIILTCDVKLLRRKLVPTELAYRIKKQGKWEQLAEVIETFRLMISKDQLLTRCTKCNGRFIPKPLTAKEAVAQGPWNQKIPDCVLRDCDEFWQCFGCKHLYWQGSIFSRAFEQFIAVCHTREQEDQCRNNSITVELTCTKSHQRESFGCDVIASLLTGDRLSAVRFRYQQLELCYIVKPKASEADCYGSSKIGMTSSSSTKDATSLRRTPTFGSSPSRLDIALPKYEKSRV